MTYILSTDTPPLNDTPVLCKYERQPAWQGLTEAPGMTGDVPSLQLGLALGAGVYQLQSKKRASLRALLTHSPICPLQCSSFCIPLPAPVGPIMR